MHAGHGVAPASVELKHGLMVYEGANNKERAKKKEQKLEARNRKFETNSNNNKYKIPNELHATLGLEFLRF
jgi:hypothetical protein